LEVELGHRRQTDEGLLLFGIEVEVAGNAHVSGGQLVLAWDLQKCGMPAAAATEAAAELDACMHP
jgi:hypothetical protein